MSPFEEIDDLSESPFVRLVDSRSDEAEDFEHESSVSPGCPRYEAGESSASKKEPGVLKNPVIELKPDTLLIADFGADWRHIKPGIFKNPTLLKWLREAKADPAATFEVIGYSDCIAPPVHNDFLRKGRAERVAKLVGARVVSVKMAPRGVYLESNLTRTGRATNRGATIRVMRPTPKWTPPVFVRPESVVEMQQVLDDAENMLIDPYQLSLTERRRLYGPAALPRDWKPDLAGALKRIDASLDFVKPLVETSNIKSHSRDDIEAKWLGLFHTSDWLNVAAAELRQARRLRDKVAVDQAAPMLDLAVQAKSLLAFRAAEKLKVLADEGLSFELAARVQPRARSQLSIVHANAAA